MAKESFLINPAKRRRKRRHGKRKASRPVYKRKRSRKLSKRRRHTVIVYAKSPKRWVRSRYSKTRRRGIRVNPVGETLMVAGANRPKRRRSYRSNRMVRHTRRRLYRNPALGVATLQRQFPHIITGALSAIAVVAVPPMLPPMFTQNPWVRYATQLGVAVGGGMLVEWAMPRKGHGMVWVIVGSAVVLAEIVKTYVLGPMLGLADVGEETWYNPETGELLPNANVEAFPAESGMSVFPGESPSMMAPYFKQHGY